MALLLRGFLLLPLLGRLQCVSLVDFVDAVAETVNVPRHHRTDPRLLFAFHRLLHVVPSAQESRVAVEDAQQVLWNTGIQIAYVFVVPVHDTLGFSQKTLYSLHLAIEALPNLRAASRRQLGVISWIPSSPTISWMRAYFL